MSKQPWEVVAWKEQLESKGLFNDQWQPRKVYPHATSVSRPFNELTEAKEYYEQLRQVKGLGVCKNWL